MYEVGRWDLKAGLLCDSAVELLREVLSPCDVAYCHVRMQRSPTNPSYNKGSILMKKRRFVEIMGAVVVVLG